ncbi:MAG: cytochrome P450, partial [Myxococcota bacterium]
LVTRFEEGSEVFSDPRLSSQRPRHDVAEEDDVDPNANDSAEALPPTFNSMDAPDHGAYRRLLSGKFTPKSVQANLQPYIDTIVTEHLDAIEAQGAGGEPVDIINQLALPIPSLVICELLGVPYGDRDQFHHATEVMMDTSKRRAERDTGAHWLVEYITKLVTEKRADPGSEGLLAELIRKSAEDGSILSDEDLIGIGVLLLFAGHDTTMAMIGLSALTLLTHPLQRQDLVEHPEKIGAAVEELLRYLTIVQFGLGRTAKEDLEIAGQAIAKGDLVVVAMPAANRDPRVFDRPDEFDITREHNAQVAFGGGGAHFCLGAHLARNEIRTMMGELATRFPDVEIVGDPSYIVAAPEQTIAVSLRELPVRLAR